MLLSNGDFNPKLVGTLLGQYILTHFFKTQTSHACELFKSKWEVFFLRFLKPKVAFYLEYEKTVLVLDKRIPVSHVVLFIFSTTTTNVGNEPENDGVRDVKKSDDQNERAPNQILNHEAQYRFSHGT